MKIEGSYVNIKGDVVKVSIENSTSTAPGIAIEPGGTLEFASEDTVTIDSGVNDSLDVCQQHSCTINLHAAEYVAELFTKEYKDGRVEVSVNDKCVFSGWLEPRTLSQPFNEVYDDLSLQCVDSLSATQYSNYKDANDKPAYSSAAGKTDMRTFMDLLKEALNKGTDNGSYDVWWDSSRASSSADTGNVFEELRVSDMAFLGDSADDTVTYLDVIESVLKFLDLHIVQYGHDFYIFSWDTIRKGTTSWSILVGGSAYASLPSCTGTATALSADSVEDMDTQLDIQEIYNQLCLTVSPKGSDTALRSPLDSSGRIPVMGARQYYVTEYAADGDRVEPARAFFDLIKGHSDNGYNSQVWKDYLIRIMRNVYWKIGNGTGLTTDGLSSVTDWAKEAMKANDAAGSTITYPEDVADKLRSGLGALLLQVGNVDHRPGTGDTSKQATISMTNELVISVNGNCVDANPYPSDSDIQAAMPLMSYEGGDAAASYSPSVADLSGEGYHNYLVIDGIITLCPVMETPFEVEKVRKYQSGDDFWKGYYNDYGKIVGPSGKAGVLCSISPSRVNKDGRYLAFDWWKQGKQTGTRKGWIPYTQDGPEQYEFKTSDNKDNVEKVDILWCMLRIGTKVLKEDRMKEGEVSAFSWVTYKKRSECSNDDEYLEQTFCIGINPKIGDKLIGTDFDIATNFDYSVNISADKGMAIPLPYDAKLHGSMVFQVLGIDNPVWADYHVTRHKTMFRHTKYGTDNIPLMAHVSSVIIKNFSVKIYSDVEDGGEDDIVYMSRTSHKFYNKKDDLEMKIHSGFTSDEISRYGLSGKIMYTTVCGKDGLALTSVYNKVTKETGKAEKLYVDAYYKELSKPRIILTQNLQCTDMSVVQTSRWTHPALAGKTFYVRDIGYNLMEGSAQAKMEEAF